MARLVVPALLVAALASGVLLLVHAGDEVYAVPGWAKTATAVLMAASVVGAALILRSRQPVFGALAMAAVALGVFGLLAIASIGLLALVAAAGLLTLALNRPVRPASALAGAVLAGAALPVLLVFALAGPVVDCGGDGTQAGENIFLRGSESEGEISETPDGEATGYGRGESYEYRFACRDGELVEFDLRRR